MRRTKTCLLTVLRHSSMGDRVLQLRILFSGSDFDAVTGIQAVGDESLLSTLDKLVSHIDAKKEPVSGNEVVEVVQRRLFQSIS